MADIYLTNTFLGFAARERISDATIVKVAREMQNQLYDASLGGCIYKSASLGLVRANGAAIGYRSFFAMKNACFMRGFAKSERENISTDELQGLKHLAALYLDYSPFRLYQLANNKELRRLSDE